MFLKITGKLMVIVRTTVIFLPVRMVGVYATDEEYDNSDDDFINEEFPENVRNLSELDSTMKSRVPAKDRNRHHQLSKTVM